MFMPRGLLSILVGLCICLGAVNPVNAEIHYVNIDAPPGGDGLTWSTAYDSLSTAIEAAEPGDQIWVATGRYVGNFTLALEVKLYGGFAGTETELSQRDWTANPTILDGNQSGSVVTSPFGAIETTRIDGFTITGGRAHDGGGLFLVSSSPTIANNMITGNRTFSHGGGGGLLLADSSATIINNTITGNSAGLYGGGLSLWGSSPTIANNTITDNDAPRGGGLSLWDSSPTIASNTIMGNSAHSGGGLYNFGSSRAVVINCILWGNSPDEILNDRPGNHVPAVIFSDVQGGLPDGTIDRGGNIDTDPLFVRNPNDGGDGWGDDPDTIEVDEGANDDFGDLRLQSGSPCINAGYPGFKPTPGETDLDGHARVLCGRVDMGAYEFGIGNHDCNYAIDLLDFRMWSACVTWANGGPYYNGCEAFDFEYDADVDLADFARFQVAFSPRGCRSNAECHNDTFCDGAEICVDSTCQTGPPSCTSGQVCDEENDVCITPCCKDWQCDDGDLCTTDICDVNTCLNTTVTCAGSDTCQPTTGICGECSVDGDCDDGSFCNGLEICAATVVPGTAAERMACNDGSDPCGVYEVCQEDDDRCLPDSDGDGVADGEDKCPDTPLGADVDANGCPFDPDSDGVPTGVDNCPNTPNADQEDNDGDDIGDVCDYCPGDANGGRTDKDGDGVGDVCDWCQGTDPGARVDADGCPLPPLWASTPTDGGVTQLLVNRIGYGLPEEYEVGGDGNLLTAYFTLDAGVIAQARSGDVTIQSTEVSLGVETNMYRVDNRFGNASFTFEQKLTIDAFDVQIVDRTATWTFYYIIHEIETAFGTDRTWQFDGTTTGDVSDDGSIVWSSVVGIVETCDLMAGNCPSLADLATPGVFPLGKWRREVIE